MKEIISKTTGRFEILKSIELIPHMMSEISGDFEEMTIMGGSFEFLPTYGNLSLPKVSISEGDDLVFTFHDSQNTPKVYGRYSVILDKDTSGANRICLVLIKNCLDAYSVFEIDRFINEIRKTIEFHETEITNEIDQDRLIKRLKIFLIEKRKLDLMQKFLKTINVSLENSLIFRQKLDQNIGTLSSEGPVFRNMEYLESESRLSQNYHKIDSNSEHFWTPFPWSIKYIILLNLVSIIALFIVLFCKL